MDSLFTLLAFLYCVTSFPPVLFLYGSATYTDMAVVSVGTSLPISFFDSHRRGDDFVYYQFDLQPESPLRLIEVIVSNKSESKSLTCFEVGERYIELSAGNYEECIRGPIKLDSKVSLLTRDTLEGQRWKNEKNSETDYFEEDELTVLFHFKEGSAKVKYDFLDKEKVMPFFTTLFSATE